MTQYVPISAPHLSLITIWLDERGHTQTVESPIMCADMSCEPPRLIPAVHAAVPEGAPQRRVLHDSKAGVWFDVVDGAVLREWKAVVAPLHAVWSAAQPEPRPSAPPPRVQLEVPRLGEPAKPPHRLGDKREDRVEGWDK